jgi:glutamate synthase domain-containing protein 3
MASVAQTVELDLDRMSLRELNQFLHRELPSSDGGRVEILHPNGRHNIAVGLDAHADVHIRGHAGYYVAGMNKRASVTVHGNVGWGVAENIMSGVVRVKGNASACVGSSGHGGLVVIEGDAASRCGISMKGCDIVVGGSVGHVSGFMAQLGRMVVCGDAGAGLGDSLYEAIIYVRGKIASLGADARVEPLSETDLSGLAELLDRAGFSYDPSEFKRVASARTLYHWNAAHFGSYG